MALTDIETCERNKKLANKINVDVLKNLFFFKKKHNFNFWLIQISTDQMYNAPFNKKISKENAKPIIFNHYTKTKVEAEKICLSNQSLILRTNFFGKSLTDKKSFSDWIYQSIDGNKPFYLLIDRNRLETDKDVGIQAIYRNQPDFHTILDNTEKIHILHGYYEPTKIILDNADKIETNIMHCSLYKSLRAHEDLGLSWLKHFSAEDSWEREMLDIAKKTIWIGLDKTIYHDNYDKDTNFCSNDYPLFILIFVKIQFIVIL